MMSTQLGAPANGRALPPIVAAVLGLAPLGLAWAIGLAASSTGSLSDGARAALLAALAGLLLIVPGWAAWVSRHSTSSDLALALFAVAIGFGLALVLASGPVSIRGLPVTSRGMLLGMFLERLVPVVIAAAGTFVATELGAAVMRRTHGPTGIAGWIVAAAVWVAALVPVIAQVLLASPTT